MLMETSPQLTLSFGEAVGASVTTVPGSWDVRARSSQEAKPRSWHLLLMRPRRAQGPAGPFLSNACGKSGQSAGGTQRIAGVQPADFTGQRHGDEGGMMTLLIMQISYYVSYLTSIKGFLCTENCSVYELH